jgi:hypothetical protein
MIFSGFIKQFLIRKLQEASTWAGVLTFLAGVCHFALPDDIRDSAVTACLAIVSLCLVAVNESRKPTGGPAGVMPPSPAAGDPPPGSVERVPVPADTQAGTDGHHVQADARPAVRPAPVSRGNAIGPG